MNPSLTFFNALTWFWERYHSKALFSDAENFPRSGGFLQIRRKKCVRNLVNFS